MNIVHAVRQWTICGVAAVGMSLAGHAMAQAASLDGAIDAAKHWTSLADSKLGDRMWMSSGQLMQKSANKDDWAKYLRGVQTEFGDINKRDWVQVVRISNPSNLPAGEYINVVFASRFTKSMVLEKVSLVQDGASWVPVGYIVTKAEQVAQVAPGTVATPAAK